MKIDDAGLTPLERQQFDLADPSSQTFWHWVRFDIVSSVADARRARTIVDIGAGSGMLGDRITERHPHLEYRFDEQSAELDRLLARRFGDAARFGASDRVEASAVAAMLDVIEHIDDDVGALSTWRRRMEPGAALVVTVPALQWAYSSWDADLGHHRRYSRRTLRAALESAGFRVLRCDYLFPELLPIVAKRRVTPSSGAVDMPRLSTRANRFGYTLGSLSSRMRRLWPVGTSAVAIAEVPVASGDGS